MATATDAVTSRWRTAVRHILCVLALMWSPIVNGQPFFFPDTTSYVRAADIVAYAASGGRLSTVWTDRYRADLAQFQQQKAASSATRTVTPVGNDVRSGSIMAGRSPYFGALLWFSYLVSNFWLFVLAQAAVSYVLILLTLRHFGITSTRALIAVVGVVAAGTALPYFNGLLLADALAAFGIVAFLLLAFDRGALRRQEQIFLWLILGLSLISHLTHVVMAMVMILLSALLIWLGKMVQPGRATVIGIGAVMLVAFGSIWLSGAVVKHVFQKEPQLVPLLTARFVADGPGLRFVREHCGTQKFAICEVPVPPVDSTTFLWSREAPKGVYLSASPDVRSRMSAEDTRFALAVLRAYPVEQGSMLVRNTVKQLLTFHAYGYNEACMADPACSLALPDPVRAELQASLSGRLLWPGGFLTAVYYAVAGFGVIVILFGLRSAFRSDPARARELTMWIVLAMIAMLACALFGGAVSEPQYRYQARLVWLLPFFASLVWLVGAGRSSAARAERLPEGAPLPS